MSACRSHLEPCHSLTKSRIIQSVEADDLAQTQQPSTASKSDRSEIGVASRGISQHTVTPFITPTTPDGIKRASGTPSESSLTSRSNEGVFGNRRHETEEEDCRQHRQDSSILEEENLRLRYELNDAARRLITEGQILNELRRQMRDAQRMLEHEKYRRRVVEGDLRRIEWKLCLERARRRK